MARVGGGCLLAGRSVAVVRNPSSCKLDGVIQIISHSTRATPAQGRTDTFGACFRERSLLAHSFRTGIENERALRVDSGPPITGPSRRQVSDSNDSGARHSAISGPSGTMPVGLIMRWLA